MEDIWIILIVAIISILSVFNRTKLKKTYTKKENPPIIEEDELKEEQLSDLKREDFNYASFEDKQEEQKVNNLSIHGEEKGFEIEENKIDLRKAILYSIILENKYIDIK